MQSRHVHLSIMLSWLSSFQEEAVLQFVEGCAHLRELEGQVEAVRVVRNRESYKGRGIAFVMLKSKVRSQWAGLGWCACIAAQFSCCTVDPLVSLLWIGALQSYECYWKRARHYSYLAIFFVTCACICWWFCLFAIHECNHRTLFRLV